MDGFVVFLAKYLIYFLVLGMFFLIFSMKTSREKFFAFIVVALTAVLSRGIFTEIIRFFYDKERPFEKLGFDPLFLKLTSSFPSGHAAFLFAVSIAILYFNRFWGFWFLGLSLLVGVSRIAAGVHFPSDILGGAVLALFSFVIVEKLLKKYKPGL